MQPRRLNFSFFSRTIRLAGRGSCRTAFQDGRRQPEKDLPLQFVGDNAFGFKIGGATQAAHKIALGLFHGLIEVSHHEQDLRLGQRDSNQIGATHDSLRRQNGQTWNSFDIRENPPENPLLKVEQFFEGVKRPVSLARKRLAAD